MTPSDAGRVVVISPHLDDAAFSLGSTVARLGRSGAHVTLLTVFAGDPASTREAGDWDLRSGFRTEGEAARARRAEDLVACRVLGAEPVWLSFPDAEYAQARDADEIWRAVCGAAEEADSVLVPGFPLLHPDHGWLAELLVGRGLPCTRIGVYAEQPYRYVVRRERPRPDSSALSFGAGDLRWERSSLTSISYLAWKSRAVRSYRSQLRLLGLERQRARLTRLLAHEALHGGEMLAWIVGRGPIGR